MALKDLLAGLMVEGTPAPATGTVPAEQTLKLRVDPARPRFTGGAIGAVSQSAGLRARAVIELDPALIDAGSLHDRIEETQEDHAALVAPIRDYGLQVLLLVRPSPGTPGRCLIVIGRRSLMELRELGELALGAGPRS